MCTHMYVCMQISTKLSGAHLMKNSVLNARHEDEQSQLSGGDGRWIEFEASMDYMVTSGLGWFRANPAQC